MEGEECYIFLPRCSTLVRSLWRLVATPVSVFLVTVILDGVCGYRLIRGFQASSPRTGRQQGRLSNGGEPS
jgi:hypothetical protein